MGWIIFGSIVLLIAILLSLSVVLVIDIQQDNILLQYRLGPIKLQLFPQKEPSPQKLKKQQEKQAKQKRKAAKAEKKKQVKLREKAAKTSQPGDKPVSGKTAEKPKKSKLSFDDIQRYVELGKQFLEASGKGFRRIIKGIRITEGTLDIAVAGEDAFEAALNYGKVSAAVWYALGVVDNFFTLSLRRVNIQCDYEATATSYSGHAAIKLRHGTILVAVLSMAFHFVSILIKDKRKQSKE